MSGQGRNWFSERTQHQKYLLWCVFQPKNRYSISTGNWKLLFFFSELKISFLLTASNLPCLCLKFYPSVLHKSTFSAKTLRVRCHINQCNCVPFIIIVSFKCNIIFQSTDVASPDIFSFPCWNFFYSEYVHFGRVLGIFFSFSQTNVKMSGFPAGGEVSSNRWTLHVCACLCVCFLPSARLGSSQTLQNRSTGLSVLLAVWGSSHQDLMGTFYMSD